MNQPQSDTPPPLRILQFTDCHLLKDPKGSFLGIRPLDTLDAVMARARESAPDLVLLTGDLAQDGSVDAYRMIRERVLGLHCPIAIIPGNHDCPAAMLRAFDVEQLQIGGYHLLDPWIIVLLDSSVKGEVGGMLEREQLDQLDGWLGKHPRHHALVCLHHQPVPVGSRWIDDLGLVNGDDLFTIIERHPLVQGVLWGHVHQCFEGTRGTIRLMATPSTSIQFKPGSTNFAVDPVAPGYRWLHLYPDGRIDSAVVRIDQVPKGLHLGSHGY